MAFNLSSHAPGIYKLGAEINVEELANFCGKQGWNFFSIDGQKVNNKDKFFLAAAQEMNFPDYFGHNWDAFADIMTDLDIGNSKGSVLLYCHPENFAENDAANWSVMMDVLQSIVEFWQETDTPMYILLKSDSLQMEKLPII